MNLSQFLECCWWWRTLNSNFTDFWGIQIGVLLWIRSFSGHFDYQLTKPLKYSAFWYILDHREIGWQFISPRLKHSSHRYKRWRIGFHRHFGDADFRLGSIQGTQDGLATNLLTIALKQLQVIHRVFRHKPETNLTVFCGYVGLAAIMVEDEDVHN